MTSKFNRVIISMALCLLSSSIGFAQTQTASFEFLDESSIGPAPLGGSFFGDIIDTIKTLIGRHEGIKDQAKENKYKMREIRAKTREVQANMKHQQRDTKDKMKEARARQREQMHALRDKLRR